MTMAFEDRRLFAEAILDGIEAPLTPQNIEFMLAWMAKENTAATFNPLATTMGKSKGYTPFNWTAEGNPLVLNYPDWETGVQETINTLIGGRDWKDQDAAARQADYYDHLVDALRDGTSLQAALSYPQIVKELGTWGSLAAYTTGTGMDGTSYSLSVEEIQQKLNDGLPALGSQTGFTTEELAGIYTEWGDTSPLVPEEEVVTEVPVEEVEEVEVPVVDTSAIEDSFTSAAGEEPGAIYPFAGYENTESASSFDPHDLGGGLSDAVFYPGYDYPISAPLPPWDGSEPEITNLDEVVTETTIAEEVAAATPTSVANLEAQLDDALIPYGSTQNLKYLVTDDTRAQLLEALQLGEITIEQITSNWEEDCAAWVELLLQQNDYQAGNYDYLNLWKLDKDDGGVVTAFLEEWVNKKFDYVDSQAYIDDFIYALENQEWWHAKTADWRAGLAWTWANRFGAGVEGSEYETQLSDADAVVRDALNDLDSSLLPALQGEDPNWVRDFVLGQVNNGLGAAFGRGDWDALLRNEVNRWVNNNRSGEQRPTGVGSIQSNYDKIMAYAHSQLIELNEADVREQASAIAAGTLDFATVQAGIDNQAFNRVDLPTGGLREQLATSSPLGQQQSISSYLQPLANAVGNTWGLASGELTVHDPFVRDNLVFANEDGTQRFRTSLEMSNLARQDARFKDSPTYKSGMGSIIRGILGTMGAV